MMVGVRPSLFSIVGLLILLICLIQESRQAPATSISKTVWNIPVQARITICRPKGQKEPPPEFGPIKTKGSGGGGNANPTGTNAGQPKNGWPLGFVPPAGGGGGQQQQQDNFEDMKKMMPMKWRWAEVPVGNDRPKDDEERRKQLWNNLPECP